MKNENGIEKSAILTGNTLVNLFNKSQDSYTIEPTKDIVFKSDLYKTSTTYLIKFDVVSSNTNNKLMLQYYLNGQWLVNYELNIKLGINKFVITSISNQFNTIKLYYNPSYGSETVELKDIMLIEYQQGMENWDIPYFEGMQSVKMPVLTTTGKNLFDLESFSNIDNWSKSTYSSFKIQLSPNTQYVLSRKDDSGYGLDVFVCLNENMKTSSNSIGWIIHGTGINNKVINFTTNNSGIIYINAYQLESSLQKILELLKEMQIEQGTTVTSYEPFKSNILSASEDVTLRGIGEVQDELDLMTGEVVEHIGEIVLDGTQYMVSDGYGVYIQVNDVKRFLDYTDKIACDKLPVIPTYWDLENVENGISGFTNSSSYLGQNWLYVKINNSVNTDEVKEWLTQNPITVQYQCVTDSIKTVDITIKDQDNQPQERMKLFPNGHINTSSSTFPPILELKGITHNNKLNMTTTNGTNNTQLTTLDNLVLDGIICNNGTVVRDSYDVESGLYTKRVFRATIDEEFVEKYKNDWKIFSNYATMINISLTTPYPKCVNANNGTVNIFLYGYNSSVKSCCITTGTSNLYITIPKEELTSYDVDGLIDWIKRNGAIEVAYQMAEPQIIHMQPNMQPYVSTRPYQGSIESQGNILESSFLDYTSEQSIISPKPLGDGDVLRWEQGSQCYVYENDKEYIPLTDYNQPMGTVLDLEEEDGEQFVENLDGGDIIVDVPFKEKAVYERHLIPYEDKVIYPTQDKLDPTGKIEVDYICGETWQNPNDLSDIQHLGTLREDGQYDVTIRRSGDDEIRLLDGITHIGLDGDGLNPSEFELTFFNSGGVEVGKYGDTIHTLEDCVLDSKLETGTIYGQTLVNVVDGLAQVNNNTFYSYDENSGLITILKDDGSPWNNLPNICSTIKPNTQYTIILYELNNFKSLQLSFDGKSPSVYKTIPTPSVVTTLNETDRMVFKAFRTDTSKIGSFKMLILEGDYTNYPMDIPYFEGVGSTIVNGFTTVGKNLWSGDKDVELKTGALLNKPFNIKAGKYYFTGEPDIIYKELTTLAFRNSKTNYTVAVYINSKNGVTLTQDCDDISIYSNGWSYPNSIDKPQTIKNFMLCKEYSTSYEPYHSVQYTLPTPITLNKIGDVADTYDVVSGVETRKTKKVTLNGSESWSTYNMSSIGNRVCFVLTKSPFGEFKQAGQAMVDNSNFTYGNATVNERNYDAFAINQLDAAHIQFTKEGILTVADWKSYLQSNPITLIAELKTPLTIQHAYIPTSIQTTQEPTFILPQPLRSVPNGICDRLYWDENKGHYCIEKRIERFTIDGSYPNTKRGGNSNSTYVEIYMPGIIKSIVDNQGYCEDKSYKENPFLPNHQFKNALNYKAYAIGLDRIGLIAPIAEINEVLGTTYDNSHTQLQQYLSLRPVTFLYPLEKSQIIDLPHLNRRLKLPTQPNTLPIGYKVEYPKANPQLGLTIPYKQLNYPSRPQNIDFKMDIADYVLTWDDVKEARQYNIILNDRTIATVKEPQWNSGEEMYGYIMVEAQNELAENLSEELYIKTVPNAPAQLTVAHNPMTDYYDFEISFIKTSAIAEYYTVQYRIDGGEWVYKTIQSSEIDPNSKVLWKFSVYEIHEQIEVWATATNDIGTNDILPTAIYYMSPTPQWTYKINSKELFVRWMDDSPYDTQYKLRYQYKSDGIYRYAYFEGDKQEIGKLYEALIPLADDEEVSIALCIISEKENLYTKPIRASKELDPNIKPPKNFNYHWLARGLIEFYWEDNYDVDVEYEAIVEHRLTSGNNEWITDTRIFSATDTEGTGAVYRLEYQLEDLEEIRVKVRMRWAMNETEWSESLTTVFIPVEGNPPQWIRRTQTQEGLLVEWEAQEYVDSYHVYVMSNGEELQHLETMDNFIYVDIDYSNPIDIEIYEATRFSGGIQSDPSDKMRFRPTMDKHQLIHDVVTPDTLTYEIEVDTVQKGIKERQVIHDINTTPKVTDKQPMDVAIKSPFTLSFHPLQLDVHQAGSKYYGDTELHIKTLDVKSRDAIEVLSFERITDQYGVDFTVYTPSASKYPITLEVNRVRIVCFGDSLTSGHPGFWMVI